MSDSLTPASATDCTVLVVEDHADHRLALRLLLEAHGYRVLEAANGEEAHERLQHALCDIMLTDVDMPRMDGAELVRVTRADPRMAAMPIVAVTGMPQDRFDRTLPADAVLFKPFDWPQLSTLLTKFECVPTVNA